MHLFFLFSWICLIMKSTALHWCIHRPLFFFFFRLLPLGGRRSSFQIICFNDLTLSNQLSPLLHLLSNLWFSFFTPAWQLHIQLQCSWLWFPSTWSPAGTTHSHSLSSSVRQVFLYQCHAKKGIADVYLWGVFLMSNIFIYIDK